MAAIFRPPGSRGPTCYGICPRPVSAGSTSTRSGSRPTSPDDIFATSPKSSRPRQVRSNRGLRFETADRQLAPKEPFWSSKRPSSARGQPSAPNTQQLREIVPVEVREKVQSTAGRGAMVIEMLWSNSAFFAHENGRKYIAMSTELVDFMAGRLSQGEAFRVLTIEEPVHVRKGMYDQFSDGERRCGGVGSNRSHVGGAGSRLGAFEVHLVQEIWDAKLCASERETHHRGAPVITSKGILCACCAGQSSSASQGLLLHSKLWTRRWPSLMAVTALTGALVIEAAPEVPQPVAIRMVSFQRRKCPELRRSSNVFFEPKDVTLPEDPKRRLKRQIQKRLESLQCECQEEWYVDSGAGSVLCSCSTHRHKLEVADLLPLLADTARLKEDEFQDFVKGNKIQWTSQPLSDFVFHFVDEHMDLVRHRNRHEYARYDRQVQRKAEEKDKRGEVAREIRRTRRRSTTVALEYQLRFEEGQDKAEQIYVALCRHLIRKVPDHQLDLAALDGASAQDAAQVLSKAIRINEARQQRWETWYRTVDSWKRDDSEKEKELFASILSYRKDICEAERIRAKDGDMATRLSVLETEIEGFYSRIRRTFIKPNEHQKNIDDLEREVHRTHSEYLEIVEP